MGWIADKIIPGKRSDFMVELPPMRLPAWGNLARKTWSRVRWFLREAVPLFVLGTVVLFVLDRLSILPFIMRMAEPVMVGLLGLLAKAGEAFVMGFLRRDYGAGGLLELARQGMMDHTHRVYPRSPHQAAATIAGVRVGMRRDAAGDRGSLGAGHLRAPRAARETGSA